MTRPTKFVQPNVQIPIREWRDKAGHLHRFGGPALESSTGAKYWWWHNRYVSRDSGEQPSLTEEYPHWNPAYYFPGYGHPDQPNPEPPSPGILVA